MSEAGQRIRLRGGSCTSVGQVRENNEDNLHLWLRDTFVVAIVADGMGGAAAGEEASRLAVETVESGFLRDDQVRFKAMADDLIRIEMRAAIREANAVIVNRAAGNPELRGMGTTVTMAFVRGSHVIVAHVGDSRAYHVDGGTRHITQVTIDHSFVEALIAAGHLTQEQAEEHPMQHVLYRALGQGDEIDVDIYETRMRASDRLVLCSDGLTRHVKPNEIAEIVLSTDDPTVAAERLIERANALGGVDNVSSVVLIVDSVQDDDATMELNRLASLPLEDETLRLTLSDDDTHQALRAIRDTSQTQSPEEGSDPNSPTE